MGCGDCIKNWFLPIDEEIFARDWGDRYFAGIMYHVLVIPTALSEVTGLRVALTPTSVLGGG